MLYVWACITYMKIHMSSDTPKVYDYVSMIGQLFGDFIYYYFALLLWLWWVLLVSNWMD